MNGTSRPEERLDTVCAVDHSSLVEVARKRLYLEFHTARYRGEQMEAIELARRIVALSSIVEDQ